MTETNPYEQAARERKASKIVSTILIDTLHASRRAVQEDPTLNLRVEQGARIGKWLTLLRATDSFMLTRERLLEATGHKGASPETWRLVHRHLAENYANLALNLCADDDPFAGLQ